MVKCQGPNWRGTMGAIAPIDFWESVNYSNQFYWFSAIWGQYCWIWKVCNHHFALTDTFRIEKADTLFFLNESNYFSKCFAFMYEIELKTIMYKLSIRQFSTKLLFMMSVLCVNIVTCVWSMSSRVSFLTTEKVHTTLQHSTEVQLLFR